MENKVTATASCRATAEDKHPIHGALEEAMRTWQDNESRDYSIPGFDAYATVTARMLDGRMVYVGYITYAGLIERNEVYSPEQAEELAFELIAKVVVTALKRGLVRLVPIGKEETNV